MMVSSRGRRPSWEKWIPGRSGGWTRSRPAIDQYDGSSNPKEFIKVYQTIIEAVGGDDWVKANFLPTTLTDAARSWLINLAEGSITSWDQLCAIFIRNF
jgi:hypothetical protein